MSQKEDDLELEISNEADNEDEEEYEEIEDSEEDEAYNEDEDEDGNEEEEDEDALDEFEVIARREYATRMEALGFKMDKNGDVVGIQETIPRTKSVEEATSDYDQLFDNDTLKLKNEIKAEFSPIMIDNYVNNIVSKNSKLGRYETEVRAILGQTDPLSITPQVVENYFWWARGQSADKEIAEAMKNKSRTTTDKVAKGKAAASESAVGKTTGKSKNAPISPIVKKLAKEWNMEPQTLANKYRDAQKEKK